MSAQRGRVFLWLPLLALALTPLILLWAPPPLSHKLEVGALLSVLPERCERVALYMGYPACQTECPQALHALASREEARCERCCVLFVNLYGEGAGSARGALDPAQRYLNGFQTSPQWRGVSPPPRVIKALEAQLSTRSERLQTPLNQPPRVTHIDLVWLLKRPRSEGRANMRAWRLVGFTKPTRFVWGF